MNPSEEEQNRQVIQRMGEGGDDLKIPRPIDFSHVFADREAAKSFAAEIETRGLRATIEETGCDPERPWDVVVTIDMAPELGALTATERDLGNLACLHGGRADGWGCIRVVDDA
jgi:hypothetical protein